MPNDHRGTSEPSDGLHGIDCFTEQRYGEYSPTDYSISLRAKSASCGGGSEVLIIFRDDVTIKVGGVKSHFQSAEA